MSNKLSDKTNQDKKFGATAASKTADSAASKKQGTGGGNPVTGRQTSKSKKTDSEGTVNESDDTGQFEDVDLSDPPREETEAEKSGFEMIDHADAPHSSRNERADHKYKYPENFGKNSQKDSK